MMDALRALEDRKGISNVVHYDDAFATCQAHRQWHELAITASTLCDWRVWPRATGLTFQRGRKTFYLEFEGDEAQRGAELMQARKALENIGVPLSGHSAANMARAALKWTARAEAHGSDWRSLQHGKHWAYFSAEPQQATFGRLWDVKACYWELFKRLPSLRLMHFDQYIARGKMQSSEIERYKLLCETLDTHKQVRNNVVGCMVNINNDGAKFALAGKWERLQFNGCAYPTAGMLIIRSAFELCQQAAIETNAIHAATDGIIEIGGIAPQAWNNVGLDTRLVRQGITDVRFWSSYWVGDKGTKLYDTQMPHGLATVAPPVPSKLYYQTWL